MTAWALTAVLACALATLHVRHGRRMELVARAAHELRGPLTAAGLALAAGSRDPRLPAVELELRRATLALGDLEAAREGRCEGERFELLDLGRLCLTQLPAWQPLAQAAGVELRCIAGGEVLVVADAARMAQATGNLLANALEHGEGDVEVRACVRHGRARVEVSDRGGGLREPPPAPVRGRGRRGRGLAIAAGIAARHGGRLAAAPAAGGTTVALELPLAPVAARRARTG